MKWIITFDNISEDKAGVGVTSKEGKPTDKNNHVAFKMRDDDGNCYYQGRAELDKSGTEEGFEPLDNYGMPNAGCTSIEYFNWKTKKYEVL